MYVNKILTFRFLRLRKLFFFLISNKKIFCNLKIVKKYYDGNKKLSQKKEKNFQLSAK
jgi:hypothetical protein